MIMFHIFKLKTKGSYLPVIMMASVLFLTYATALAGISISNVKMANLHNKQITAMSIAEAGLNYYLWHLAHDNDDYCDGEACSGAAPYGPFSHDYKDKNGQFLGTYELYISPPEPGISAVVVRSVGKVSGKSPKRTIVAELGIPSLTKYTLLTNGNQLWVDKDKKIDGTVHVNDGGLYNEGEITGDASSTELTYAGWFGTQPGVAGPGVFGGNKLFPVPAVNFDQINVDIANLRDGARDSGLGQYYDFSGRKGYHLVLQDNSYDLYSVKKYDTSGLDITEETLIGTYSYPAQGIIFLEDNAWVEGILNNRLLTIIAADPEAGANQKKRIIIPNSIRYSHYDGSDKLGLITQTGIMVGRSAPADLEIDAAMIAKDGQIKIENYGSTKNKIKIYGSMAHNGGLVFSYVQTPGGEITSGYKEMEIIADKYNVSVPPPKFPATGVYSILSWREE